MKCTKCKKYVSVLFQGICPDCTQEKYLKRFLKDFEKKLKGSPITRKS